MLRLDEHRTFVDATAAAGVRHLVYTSFYGAAPDAHAGSTYDLTGPEARTLAEIADTMTDVLGRPFAFHVETVEEARALRRPDRQDEAWVARTPPSPRGRWTA